MTIVIISLTATAAVLTLAVAAYLWRLRENPAVRAIGIAFTGIAAGLVMRIAWVAAGWDHDTGSALILAVIVATMGFAAVRLWLGNGGRP
jgi:riboflavin transporter FmnP